MSGSLARNLRVTLMFNGGKVAVHKRFPPVATTTKHPLENAVMPLGLGLIMWSLIGSAIYYFL